MGCLWNSYNPYSNPEGATERRETVLDLMYRHGYITKEERDIANSIPVESLVVEQTKEIVAAGINEVGENRKDTFLEKYEALKDQNIIWHYFIHSIF